ncbi:MAG: AAA family ATPase [Lachnospiraceae bacterium]|nr:AAA family ATPase [Lachnospiraceae bacterium]
MPTMAVMTGIQASGKSTFCRAYLSEYVRINLDTLHTRNKENSAMEEAFCAGKNMVIDNTNPTAEERRKYILKAKEHGYKVVGYFMQSRVQECIARNELREGKAKVPAKAIAATSHKLELPSCEEGFDELYFVCMTDAGMAVEKWKTPDSFCRGGEENQDEL